MDEKVRGLDRSVMVITFLVSVISLRVLTDVCEGGDGVFESQSKECLCEWNLQKVHTDPGQLTSTSTSCVILNLLLTLFVLAFTCLCVHLQGPPGTGKSRTACQILRGWVVLNEKFKKKKGMLSEAVGTRSFGHEKGMVAIEEFPCLATAVTSRHFSHCLSCQFLSLCFSLHVFREVDLCVVCVQGSNIAVDNLVEGLFAMGAQLHSQSNF